MSRVKESEITFHIGDNVRIRASIRSPYAGHTGTISQIDWSEDGFDHLVRFSDGLAFRYTAGEMELIKVAA
jgi:hypothetical protein